MTGVNNLQGTNCPPLILPEGAINNPLCAD